MEKKKFFYGWIVLFGCFLIMSVTAVFIYNTWSYYQMSVCEGLGCSYVAFSSTNIPSTIATMLLSLLLAGKIATGKTRLYMLIGGVVAGLAWVAQSYATQIWHIYVTFFVANFALSATLYIPINILISNWFVDRKGMATSFCFAGGGIGGMLFTNLIAGWIANNGWSFSMRMSGIITVVVALVVFILIRKTPEEMGQEPYRIKKPAVEADTASAAAAPAAPVWMGLTKKEAVKTAPFWVMVIVMICCGMIAAGVVTQIPTFLIENGIDYAGVMVAYSAATIASMILMGPLFDKIGIGAGVTVASILVIISMVFTLLAPSNPIFAYVGIVLFAFGCVVGSLVPPLLAGKIFGYKDFGAIYGLANFFFMAGCMVGPVLSSAIRTSLGTYNIAWIAYIVISVILAGASLVAIKMGKSLVKMDA